MRLYLSSYGIGDKGRLLPQLAGSNVRVAVIANALDSREAGRKERVSREIASLRELGLEPEELDLRDYFGRQDLLREKLTEYGLVWVRGGNVFLLRRSYYQSGFDEIITDLLANDNIAYSGYSAGVCILGPSLKGIELVDPIEEVADGYDDKIIFDGLGVIDYAIAPHYRSDHPESADIEKLVAYYTDSKMPFKTLRDGEVIVVGL